MSMAPLRYMLPRLLKNDDIGMSPDWSLTRYLVSASSLCDGSHIAHLGTVNARIERS